MLVNEVLSQLALLERKYSLSIVTTRSFQEIVPISELQRHLPEARIIESVPGVEMIPFIKSHQVIVIPLLSSLLAAKIALGLTDSLPSILVLQALLLEKPVLATREIVTSLWGISESAEESSSTGDEPPAWSGVQTATAALQTGIPYKPPVVRIKGLYQSYLRTLEQWGIKFTIVDHLALETEKLLSAPAPPKKSLSVLERKPQCRQIITRDDLLELLRQGINELRIKPDAIITDAAREFANDHSIKLILEQERK
ncbi:MAG: hypothetical protein N2246_01260 [Candidatus Sumerlaeia bacterium]|nr:hypothetical protein [Candidatus Sumerlaeia bacterium]